ncbi:peptidoglycan recognition protein [Kitasatospora sp. NPDC059577]|uniref:peptidoglycan recognition protein family protein n=1 Tax=Kitasatospora sp. NPDC059577 TaxID=3346873 RepID=UPI00367F19A5
MRISLLAGAATSCIAVLLLQSTAVPAVAVPAVAEPVPAEQTSAGGGTVTSLSLTSAEHSVTKRTTKPFSLIGVSWDDPRQSLAGTSIRVRTHRASTGTWTDWHQLAVEGEDAPDERDGRSGIRGSTAPLWTGRSDGVTIEVTPGPNGLPAGLRAELVDPGKGAASSAPRTLPAETAAARMPQDHEAPRPGIVTRAGWGADESLRDPGFVYTGTVKAVFVHHTDTTTDYACGDAPQMIRAIYQYHVQSNGWRDIGYNFLVDRCGTIYEGRAGGVAQPVLGAHTLGFNTDSAGVAALGTFTTDGPPQDLVDGVSKIAAWKLGLTGQDAAGHTNLTSGSSQSRYPKGTVVSFDTVSGHRDAFATECPGDGLYDRLGDIRSWAAHLQGR